jgi:hypothetical protein
MATQFLIIASKASYCERTEMVSKYLMNFIHNEYYEGTIDQVTQRLQQLKDELIKSNQFDKNSGFSLDATIYPRTQRKPNGYDKRRRDLCTNYINHQ